MPNPYTSEWFECKNDGSLSSARSVLSLVFSHVRHESVVDVGCALGAWLSVAQQLGAQRILGIDGEYVPRSKLMITEFIAADLTGPVVIPDKFDLAICVEVAEHLPSSASDLLIALLTRLAPVVLFSAAVPLQGGHNHFNEQWPEYWAGKFFEHGFLCYDAIRKRIWMNDDIDAWYRQNMLIFSRQTIHAWATDRVQRPLPLIHPLLRTVACPAPGLGKTLRSVPSLALQSVRFRLSKHRSR